MRHTDPSILTQCFRALLRPIVCFGIRHSVKVQDAIELVKVLYLDVASEELQRHHQEPNVSRLSALTGLHRRDVVRIFRLGATKEQGLGVTFRVIGRWQSDRRFTTKGGKPRVLTVDGPNSDFRRLMDLIATDLKPGTVLFELERIGVIERVKGGVRLRVEAYEVDTDPVQGFQMLADDTNDLIMSAESNLLRTGELRQLHGKTVYDNIAVESLKEISEWLIREASRFHGRVRRHLARFDLDINSNPLKKGGGRVAFCTFARLAMGVSDTQKSKDKVNVVHTVPDGD